MDNNIYNCLNLQNDNFQYSEMDVGMFDSLIDDTNESLGSYQDFGSIDESKQETKKPQIMLNPKISEKTKRIQKREKAKQRCIQVKEEEKLDDKQQKKMTQMIRNRISAQNSRDRKKQYVQDLEQINKALLQKNQELELQIIELQKNQTKSNLCENCSQVLNESNREVDTDISLNSPIYGSPKGSFYKMSFAMFALISVLCIMRYGEQQQINSMNQLQLSASTQEKEISSNSMFIEEQFQEKENEFDVIDYINNQETPKIDYQRALMEFKRWKQIKDQFEIQFQEQNKFLKVYNQNQNNALTLYSEQIKDPSNTLFCQNPYLYQSIGQIEPLKSLQNSDFVHLLIPQNNMTTYEIHGDKLIKKFTNIQDDESNILDLLCKVYSVSKV